MKRNYAQYMLLIVVFCWIAPVGCKTTANPPLPPGPGYNNAADQQMGQILAAANDFYHTVQCETQSLNWNSTAKQCVADPNVTKPLVLDPTVKQAFNTFGTSLNVANTTYLAYRNGTATESQAQTAVNAAQSQQSALPLPGAK